MKRFLTGVVFLSFVLGASAGWVEPKGEPTRQGDAQAAFTRGTATREGAYKLMAELVMCSVFYEMMAKTTGPDGRSQAHSDELMELAGQAERTGFFFVKRFFTPPEWWLSISKQESVVAHKKLDPTIARDKAKLDEVKDFCVKKAPLMALVRPHLEKADR